MNDESVKVLAELTADNEIKVTLVFQGPKGRAKISLPQAAALKLAADIVTTGAGIFGMNPAQFRAYVEKERLAQLHGQGLHVLGGN